MLKEIKQKKGNDCMKKAVIAFVVLGIVGAGGYGVYHHFFENTENSGRVSSTSEDAVYVDQVSAITGFGSGNGLVQRYGGEVEPQETLEVKLESDRTVKQCFVKEGDDVKTGQRLFVYDTQDDEDKLAQAQIDIEKAQGDIEVSKKQIASYEKAKANASSDEQLEYTTNIMTAQTAIKQSEYEIKTKELEAVKLGFQSASSMQYQNLQMEVGNCPSLDYSDLSRDAWYHQCVDYALENDLMTGMGGGIFSPNGTLTRAEAVTVLWKLENRPQVSYQLNFDDVAEGQWFTEMVRWAVSKKIMAGNGDGTFGPNDPVSREQLAVILYNYSVYKGYDVTAKGNLSSFTDASRISSWATKALQWANGAKLMNGNGDGTINPTGKTKRCEFASMIMKFCEKIAAP